MPPEAKVILDSISPLGYRLTTMEVKFHRFVLAEFNTHRDFSRNSASSRAIPLEKQLQRVKEDPAWPLVWAGEQAGMSGNEELDEDLQFWGQQLFKFVHGKTIQEIEAYLKIIPEKKNRIHKSLINRLLEPFLWHTAIVSSTGWENFFNQRCDPAAQPEIRAVAELMREAYNNSKPQLLVPGNWHTPYIQPDEQELDPWTKQRISVARCARVSYLTHDGTRDIQEDLKLFTKLVTSRPMHASPLEHVATPANEMRHAWGNFQGWAQLRHQFQEPWNHQVLVEDGGI